MVRFLSGAKNNWMMSWSECNACWINKTAHSTIKQLAENFLSVEQLFCQTGNLFWEETRQLTDKNVSCIMDIHSNSTYRSVGRKPSIKPKNRTELLLFGWFTLEKYLLHALACAELLKLVVELGISSTAVWLLLSYMYMYVTRSPIYLSFGYYYARTLQHIDTLLVIPGAITIAIASEILQHKEMKSALNGIEICWQCIKVTVTGNIVTNLCITSAGKWNVDHCKSRSNA